MFEKKTKVKTKVETKKAASAPVDALEQAKSKLARFTDRRKNAATPKEYNDANFWVAHFQKLVDSLKTK